MSFEDRRHPYTDAHTKDEHDALVNLRNGRPITQDPMGRRTTIPAEPPRRSWIENFFNSLRGDQ